MSQALLVRAGCGDGGSPIAGLRDVSPLRRTPVRLQLTCMLLLVSAVAWRQGTYYDGGADVVVVAKAALTMLALGLALTAPHPRHSWGELRAAPVLWLIGYLLVAMLGGLFNGDGVASFVLVVRLLLFATTLLLLFRAYGWQDMLSAVLGSMLILGLVSVATGFRSLAEGRLEGGIPPVNPNTVCLLFSVPLITLLWRMLNRTVGWREGCLIPLLLGFVWLTGSRTGFAALVLAALLIVVTAARISVPVFALIMVLIPGALSVAAYTPALSDFVSRGDPSSLTTLNSRTVAWSAALTYPDTVGERLLGGGLALKVIPVSAMYRTEQILDSTWVSALVQVGVLGTALLALFVVATVVSALLSSAPQRSLFVATLAYLTVVSFLESGMFDTTVLFVAFFTLALCAGTAPRERFRGRAR